MCTKNCKCNKCKNDFLPISGSDVVYYDTPLEIIGVDYGDDYEVILKKLNDLIFELLLQSLFDQTKVIFFVIH